ncbi:MAG: ABC transporter substrate-binding protein/permease [Gemmataceae bacterium]
MKRPLALLAALLLTVSGCRGPTSDTVAEVRQRGKLRWGADEEGGGPYIYRDTQDVNRRIGFEIDLMAELARGLGVESEFVQGNWKNLLTTLSTRSIDIAVNGIELTTERLRTNICTQPYFIYELVLLTHKDDRDLTAWDRLAKPRPDGRKWVIGVLEGTAAAGHIKETYPNTVEVREYEGTTEAFRDIEKHGIDGTVTDTPAAVFYAPQFPVRTVGATEKGYYVIYLRPGDEALRDRLNELIREAIGSGRLKDINTRYNVWYPLQEELTKPEIESVVAAKTPKDAASGGWATVWRNRGYLLDAAWMTVRLSLISMPIAVLLGLLIALGRLYGPAVVRFPLALYVEIVRGTPLLLQLLFLYFGVIPMLHLPPALRDQAPVIASILGLSLNYAAYEAEIYRAGLLAIPAGQMEAALALGLTRRQALRHVIVPQAVRLVIPPVTNDFINLFKDTAVCSVVSVVELSKQYNILVNNTPTAFIELALAAAGLYLIMSYPLSLLTRRLERESAHARA